MKDYMYTFNRSFKKRMGIVLAIFAIVLFVIGFGLFTYFNTNIERLVNKESRATLENVSSQNIITIHRELKEKENLLKSISVDIVNNEDGVINLDRILNDLGAYSENFGFFNMGLVMPDGTCYTTNGETMNLAKYSYIQQGFEGKASLTESYLSEDEKYTLNIFTYPVYKNEEVIMVLTATYRSSYFSQRLNVSSFEGEGQSVVINQKGEVVASPRNIDLEYLEYFLNLHENNPNMLKKLQKDMKRKKSGFTKYSNQNESYLAYYEPLVVNNWYIVSFVPRSIIYTNAEKISGVIHNSGIVVFGAFSIMILLVIYSYMNYQKNMNTIVFEDDLTKEKNFECLKVEFRKLKQSERKNRALLVFDIDKFKTVNIIYGVKVGDQVLLYLAKIFHEIFEKDRLYRQGADLFIGVVSCETKEELIEKLDQFCKRIEADVELQKIVPITISMGICSLDNKESLHTNYSNALMAKTKVKEHLNLTYNFYDEAESNQIIKNRRMESYFPKALQRKEFEVWYQPKVDMRKGEICGAEALVRWRKADGTLVPPGEFIPLFEHNGQIVELDKEVIRIVCRDLYEMKCNNQKIVPVSLNLSRVHLEHRGIVEMIQETVKQYEIDPEHIIFEITESALFDDKDAINHIISQLHEMGFTVDMDDYGTGTSTIGSLSSSKFDTLKLDKSFIDGIKDQKMDIIIKSTISMVKNLKMNIIAEGVECEEQVKFLLANDCYIGQGYYFYKPLPKAEFLSKLACKSENNEAEELNKHE